jgi:hypothetical protein
MSDSSGTRGVMKRAVPNSLNRTEEYKDDQILYRFGNGLLIKTENIFKKDPMRILPLGNPQGSLMNYMLNFPEAVMDKDIFEPFAGSGPLGLMALKIGARYAEFQDINPRAVVFQTENARLNNFSSDRHKCIQGDIMTFAPENKFDVIFANPPFIPTPDGIDGTITSNGGREGNRFIEVLFERLDTFLKPMGEAFICAFQIVENGKPLIVNLISQHIECRPVEITPAQENPIDFHVYFEAYLELFPQSKEAVIEWKSNLNARYGENLSLNHYVVHIRSRTETQTTYSIVDNFEEKFGADLMLKYDEKELARGRVFENVILS